MKPLVVLLILASIVAGGVALMSPFAQPPWSHGGRNHQCSIKCPPGTCPVDHTPQNKNDCDFGCEPC